MLHPTFFKLFANFSLTRWFVDVFFSRVFPPLFKGGLCYTLMLLRARVYADTYKMLHEPFNMFTPLWNGRFLHLHQNICNNHCNTATKVYHTRNQRAMVADHLQRAMVICHRTVTDVTDGFQRICNRNALIFWCTDFRCRCVCDSIWQDKNIDTNDA